ncbi:MAG: nucleoporin [Terriglobus roseus]|nr:nucleoporin [Terriglobus roseus]
MDAPSASDLLRIALESAFANDDHHSGNASSSTTASKPTTSLFGATAQASQPQQTGGLFGTTAPAPQAQQSGSLFGGTTAVNSPAGSLFGQRPSTGGGLFGSTATSQPQQAQGGLFGSTSASTAPSGGLFGTAASQPPQTGSLFGSLGQPQQQQQQAQQQQPQQQQQPTGGLFGSLSQPQAQQQPASLFAAPQPQTQPQQGGGLFGLSAARPAPNASLFGGSLSQPSLPPLGQSTQSQQTVPGVRIDLSNVKGVTRFSDLHDDVQKDIILIEEFIQKQMSFKDQIDAVIPKTSEQVELIEPDVNYLTGKADTMELALDNDVQAIKSLRELVQQDVDDAKLSFRSIENLKLPPQFHYQSGWQPSVSAAASTDDDGTGPVDLMAYFNSKADSLDAQLQRYLGQVAEIETHLRTLEDSAVVETERLMRRRAGAQGGDAGTQGKLRELAHTMRLFEDAIVNVASRVGAAREEMADLSVGGVGSRGAVVDGGASYESAWQRSATAPPAAQSRRTAWS